MNSPSNLLDESFGYHYEKGLVILVEDCIETSGDFVLHHIIRRALKSETDGALILLTLSHPFQHYLRILKKLGCNLNIYRDNNKLFFFDLREFGFSEDNEGNVTCNLLVTLYEKIQRAVKIATSSEGTKNSIIMIDDMSLLEAAVHGSVDQVLNFLHYCRTIASEMGSTLVMLNHEDIYSSTDAAGLISHLEYLADIMIKVAPLATGLAADVHGQLTVINKETLDIHSPSRKNVHYFHFKVKENNVEYFYPGSNRL